jgi:hypothetical protein
MVEGSETIIACDGPEANASRLACRIEQARLAKQPFEAGVTARWRVERSNESGPPFGVEREDPAIRKPLLGFAERSVKPEFADRLAFGGRGRLQRLFFGRAEPKINLFRLIGALGHFTLKQLALSPLKTPF